MITWTNPSDQAVSELQFHLYYNAFKNTSSTFMQESGRFSLLTKSLKEECHWAFSEILELKDEAGNILTGEFIAPDDGNEADQTVYRVALMQPVPPGGTSKYFMKWEAKIPKSMVRTGYNQDYYFFAQWFPKLGVYEPAGMRYERQGAWSCHQYHALGEYYGEFGDYKVTIEIPDTYIVGASGQKVEEVIRNGRKAVTFEVKNVIDFAWTCSPHFQTHEEKWQDVDIKLFYYPSHAKFVDRYFTAVKQALTYMQEYVGNYPYSSLTMVDSPIHGLFAGGMEYPTLFSSLSSNLLPSGFKAPETLVVHEFVHQYFMQMVATNEQEEPWMDEGITTYYEGRIMDHYYGEEQSLFQMAGIQMGNQEYNRYEFWSSDNPQVADNSFMAREFVHGGYGPIAYNKTAMMLRTLEGILSRSKFDEIMKIYFETWKFHHPCGLDFIQIFQDNISNEYLKELQFDLNLFFEQALYGTAICDYRVTSIENENQLITGGLSENLDDCEPFSVEKNKNYYNASFVLERLGDMILPVEVKVEFESGRQEFIVWGGKERSKAFSFSGTGKISKVQLDPNRKLILEKNFIDNTLSLEQNKSYRKYTSRFKVGIQNLLDFLNFLS
ncbi:M1 family metallopeptidase [Portibacter marinus]|uniref:M1 family metallopeptidase n=1 Tax=Portibacter marinus TaxID=2898660 RepID=UPI001F36A588|nr:M1 family metallopeptidase [Portibacter marinus]